MSFAAGFVRLLVTDGSSASTGAVSFISIDKMASSCVCCVRLAVSDRTNEVLTAVSGQSVDGL